MSCLFVLYITIYIFVVYMLNSVYDIKLRNIFFSSRQKLNMKKNMELWILNKNTQICICITI